MRSIKSVLSVSALPNYCETLAVYPALQRLWNSTRSFSSDVGDAKEHLRKRKAYEKVVSDLRRGWVEKQKEELWQKQLTEAKEQTAILERKLLRAERMELYKKKLEERRAVQEAFDKAQLAKRRARAAERRERIEGIYASIHEQRKSWLLEQSKDWVTQETLDARIEEALNNPLELYD